MNKSTISGYMIGLTARPCCISRAICSIGQSATSYQTAHLVYEPDWCLCFRQSACTGRTKAHFEVHWRTPLRFRLHKRNAGTHEVANEIARSRWSISATVHWLWPSVLHGLAPHEILTSLPYGT